jgi:hypothetical protein
MSNSPESYRVERQRPRLSEALRDELRQSVHNLETSRRNSIERPRLSHVFTDELRQSVHNRETARRASTARPRLSSAFTDELRQSVHKLEAKTTNQYTAYARPKLSKAFSDELRKSVHNREKKVKRNLFGRPKLSEAFTDELRLSVHNMQEKSSSKKKGLFGGLFGRKKETTPKDMGLLPSKPTLTPVKEKTPSSSHRRHPFLNVHQVQPLDMNSDDAEHQPRTPTALTRLVLVKSPSRSPNAPSQCRNSSVTKRAVPNDDDSSIDKSCMDNRRSNGSKQSRGSNVVGKSSTGFRPPQGRGTKEQMGQDVALMKSEKISDKKRVAAFLEEKESSLHSKSFHDDTSQFQHMGNFKTHQTVSMNDVFSRAARSTHSRSIMDEQSRALDELENDDSDLLEQTEGDMEAFRKEWIRLIKEKKQWKNKLATSRARNTILTQQVDDMSAENADLKTKLKRWEEKNAMLLEQQRADRIKMDNSADKAIRNRVELTKATNDNSKLKSRIFELESGLVTKDRLVEDLNDTIERQADIIETLSNKLKDTETTKRLMEDEKRRLEDEIAVLIAKSEGDDMRDTFRQLEEEREKFFWQREMEMEGKRLELEKLNDHHLRREKVRHDKEMERHAEDEKRRRQSEEDRGSIEELMSEQLEELKEENRRLRDQFQRDRSDMAGEMKEKEHEIVLLEREILGIQKQLSACDRSAKEVELQKAQAQAAKDDLRDMRRHKVLLEKEIKRLKKNKGKNDSQDWREIVFPGYRGVSFGTENSESLGGFLTILVEEHGNKSRKGKRSSIDLSKILDEGKKSSKRIKREKEKSGKSKTKGKGRSRSRDLEKGTKKKKHEKKKTTTTKKGLKIKDVRKGRKSGKHKKQSKRSNKTRHKSERKRSIYLDNSMTLDENLDLMWRQSRYDRKSGDIMDDMSMLVFKQTHHKNRRSASATPSRRQSTPRNDHRRRSRSNPPPEILLQ